MENNYPYDIKLLWEVTNFGLDFWHETFPDSVGKENKSRHFKTHNEKTASTTLSNKGSKDGVYRIFNHAVKEGATPVQWIMKERNLNFVEALGFLFEKYNLAKSNVHSFKPETTFKDTKKQVGTYKINYKKEVSNYQSIFPFANKETFVPFNFKQVESYSKVVLSSKTDKLTEITVTANENYPIFAYDNDGFAKMYEPKASKDDKYNLKHHFLGTKPERFVYGWEYLFELVDLPLIESIIVKLKFETAPTKRKALIEELDSLKLDEVFICTGGSDGMNVASLGKYVIWYNSEAEIPTKEEIYELKKIAKNIYYIPDLDATGKEQALKLGLKHLDVKIVWLPEVLAAENKKDIADWVRKHKHLPKAQVEAMFNQLVSMALNFKFWQRDKDKGRYSLNNKIMLYFLKHNGFHVQKLNFRSADGLDEEQTRLVHINKNIVKVVTPRQIKNFVLQWLDENYIDIQIYNMILKSVYFSETHLLSLPEIELNTKSAGNLYQYYYFKNKAIKVTPAEIVLEDYKAVKTQIWENEIKQHYFELTEPMFEYYIDENNCKRIKVLNTNSNYFKVLINTSRIFWRKDANETGHDTNPFNIHSDNLTDEENQLQEIHLLNKIYVVGYMLHKYKTRQKAYFTLGLDYINPKSIKDSNGRSGKSFLMESLKCFLRNWKHKDGKGLAKENPQFIFDKVTENTDFIFFDDLHEHQDYNFFFSKTTSNIEANHKGGAIYDVSFEDAPKIGATTNFAPMNLSASLQGRLLAYYVSDYYHQATEDNEYLFTRQISDDFGGRQILASDYSEKEWNNDYNFMLQCLQFYLSCTTKVEAPMNTIINKSLRIKIGDDLFKLFTDFFDSEKFETWILKQELIEDYKNNVGGKHSPQRIKDSLIDFCKMKSWSIDFKKIAVINDITKKRNSLEHFIVSETKNKVDFELPKEENQIDNAQHFVDFNEDEY